MFKDQLLISIRFTLVTAILLGIGYPLAVTGFAHVTMRDKADGQLIIAKWPSNRLAHPGAELYQREVFSSPPIRSRQRLRRLGFRWIEPGAVESEARYAHTDGRCRAR